VDIVVAAKYVPDIHKVPDEAWDRERGTLKRQLLQMVFNPLDRVALKTALRLRERCPGARVTVVTMGPPIAVRLLREALAHGADQAVLLTDPAFAGSDTLATAHALTSTIRHLVAAGRVGEAFVLVCGMQSPDGDTAQVPAQMASLLDVPIYPYVCDLVERDGRVAYRCLNPVGFQVVTPRSLPYVITTTRLAEDLPFHVSLEGMLRANRAAIETLDAASVGAEGERIGLDGSRTRVVRVYASPRKAAGAEPLLADHEAFARQARDLWRRLREAYTQKPAPATGAEEETAAAHGEPYYRGDCLALCEVEAGRLTPVSFEVVSRCARLARQLDVPSGAVLYAEKGPDPLRRGGLTPFPEMADALRQVGASTLHVVEPTEKVSGTFCAKHPSGRSGKRYLTPFPAAFRVREQALALAAFLGAHRPQVVILPATLTGRVVAPYVAARLDCGLTADCSALDVADFAAFDRDAGRRVTYGKVLQQTRPALGGNVMARIVSIYRDRSRHRPQMATARPGALERVEQAVERCEVVPWSGGKGVRYLLPERPEGCFAQKVPDTFSEDIEVEQRPEAEAEIDLNDFEVVVCVGMGVRDGETIERVVRPFCERLGEFLGCAVGLGCSRAVVDGGILPHNHQIGQTGTVVKPALYIGLGVSGAIQHRIGMEGARLILCLNRDAQAPMHALADFSILGEIEAALPILQKALDEV